MLASCQNLALRRKRESISPSNTLWSAAFVAITGELFNVLEHGKAEYFHSLFCSAQATLAGNSP